MISNTNASFQFHLNILIAAEMKFRERTHYNETKYYQTV